MPNHNRVTLIGHLTRDLEVRSIPSGTSVANFGLAINRKWKTQAGEQQEEVTFVDCEAWGKQADTLSQYVGKGDPLMVEGRLKLDQWESKEGEKRSKLKVVVEQFQFLGGGNGGGRAVSEPASFASDDMPF